MMMLSRRTLVPLAVAAGLLTASPAGASTAGGGPSAQAAGGDVPPAIPGIVRTRVKRTTSALDRLSANVDAGDAAAATSTGKVIRQQLAAAWRGARYYIKHAPPPPAADARVHPPRARVSGGAPVGPVAADPPTVALAVFQLEDDVVSGIVGLLDGADAPMVGAMAPVLTFAFDSRDAAIQDVHALAPPPSAGEARVVPRARAAGGAVVNTFDTVMPQVAPMLDDEVQQIEALKTEASDLQPAGKKLLRPAETRILLTQRQVNAYWPPVPAGD